MKKTILFLILAIVSINVKAKTDTLKVETKITEATVYLRGAQITRQGKIFVPKGNSDIILYNLSPDVDANSISIQSEQNIMLLGVMHQKNYFKNPEKTKEVLSLEKKKKELNENIVFEQNMIFVYQQEEAMILANRNISSSQQGVSVSELRKTADFYREKLSEIKIKQLECNRKIIKYNDEINKISKQLNELNVKKEQPTSEIIITIYSEKAQNITLNALYLINNAGWHAKYDLRAINITKPISLIYKGEVYQNSGFDWKNVKLTLSTGEPLQNGTKPELQTWWLSFVSYSTNSKDKANKKTNSTTHTFKIKTPYTIPTDGKYHSIEIIKYSLPSEYEYSSIPKKDEDAFLIARITDWEQYHLLNGNINLFFEGTFIGKSELDVNIPDDTLSISLGRDKNIIIEREKLKDFTKERIIGNKKVITYVFEINIRNNKSEKISLVVEDQIPVSQNSKIDIKLDESSDAEYDEETGKLLWDLELKPAEKKTLKFQYTVKYPKDETVVLE